MSIRKACKFFRLHKSIYFYKRRKDEQALLTQRIQDMLTAMFIMVIGGSYPFLQREGYVINHKRVYGIYKEQSLQMRRKKPKRRAQAKPREERVVSLKKNEVWSMDFVSDALFTGEKIRILIIVDA